MLKGFFQIGVLIAVLSAGIAAQKIVDPETYNDAVRTIRAQSAVSLKMPTFFIVPSYFTAKQRKLPLITTFSAGKDSYSVAFCYSGICQGAYNYGEATGEKITAQTDEFNFDKTVALTRGITGFYQKSSCGSSCGNAWIFWRQDGYLYSISLIVDDLNALIKVANSAIESDSVEQPADSVEAFLKTVLKPDDRVEIEAKGDINGDGVADWAGVIHRKKDPPLVEKGIEADSAEQLYLLLGQRQGGYLVAEKSKETGIFGVVNAYIENLEIRHSSLFLQVNSGSMFYTVSQFRFYRGEWRLVGLKETQNITPSVGEYHTTDRNLLTGTVFETWGRDDRKPRVKSYRKKFRRVLLKDFDLMGWTPFE